MSNRIKIASDATVGKIRIPEGEYWVGFNAEGGRVSLIAGGKSIEIPAIRRRTASRVRRISISRLMKNPNFSV